MNCSNHSPNAEAEVVGAVAKQVGAIEEPWCMVAFTAVIDASKEDGMETFWRRTPPKGSLPLKGGLDAPE